MWSSSRRTILHLLAALALSACGFEPAFGPGGAATKLQTSIQVDAPADKNSFDLVERLEQRLGRSRAATYGLGYSIATLVTGVGITPDNAIIRYSVTGSVRFTLTDLATGAQLTSGTVESFTSYSASGTTVSTLAAERDANARLMRLLADQIVARLIATSGAWGR